MTYNEIMSKAGRKIDPKVTYYNENTQVVVSNDDYISGKPKFETGLLGTIMKGLELELKVLIPSNTINFENKASYENESVTKNYGEYNLKETPTFNADTQTYTYQFYDNFLKFMIPYKPIEISYPCSVLDFTKKLIQTLGFTCNITYLPNGTNTLASDIYKDINMTYRDVLEDIGKATFTLFEMDNKEVKRCNFKENEVIIDDDLLMNKNIAFDKKNGAFNTIILSRSADSDNLSKSNPVDLADDLKVAYKISDCQMLNDNNRGDFIDDILSELYGIEYYVYDTQLVGYGGFKPLQKVKFITGGNTYVSYVMSNEEVITQGYEEYINAPEMSGVEQDYKTTDIDDRRLQSVSLIVDKQGKTITAQAKDIGELNSKTAQLRLDVDKIEGEITEIADITTTSEGVGTISVLKVAKDSEPIYLKVRPTTKNLALLYPADNLYPSDDLYPLERYLLFKSGNYEQRYRLPADLWYYNSTTYDEFVLDYNNQRCYVIHRVGVNADGTTYILDSVTEEKFTYPSIPLAEGDYQISLEGHETAYIYARLMAQNIYTDQFVTQVEYKAQVNVTAKEISTIVKEKVGKTEVISSINQSAEAVKVKANKIEIDGVLTAINNNTTTTINGDKITTGSITTNQIKTGAVTADKVSSDVITTKNFNAQSINADNITTGTIRGRTISGGSINGTSIKGGSIKIGNRETTIANNGEVSIYPDTGGVYRFADGAVRFNANKGAVIASSSNGSVYAGSGNLDLKACSGADAYLGCMLNANGTTQRSSVTCQDGILKFFSAGYCTYNGSTVFGSSSKATKENIKPLTQKQKEEVYELIKQIPTKQYDYKKQYGKPFNYGFVIEDIEDTKLKDLLHITQNEENKDIKMYSTEDLVRLQLITIQELMKKIDNLQERVSFLENQKI
jgi:hypothetical protein